MKTGGTLNFLKRAGAILMVVAIFASSCNKYADDFKQLNTKLDALAQQVAGVTQLTTDNAALKAQITALQTAVAALPTAASVTALQTGLTAVTAKIDAITTTLGTVATAGAATKTVVDGLKTDLATLSTKITTDNASMIAKLTALGTTNDAQTAQLTSIVSANATILANIATLQNSLNGVALTGSATDAATALTIKGLQLMLQAQKVVLDQLLANSNMYNGDVTITTGPELTFWSKKVAQLGMINGNLTVNTTNLSTNLDSVNFVTKNISAVIGTQGLVKNSVTITSTSTATLLDLSKLVSVSGDYIVNGVKISDANLSSVGGNFLVNYDGAYTYPNLSTVGGNLTLTKIASSTTSPVKAGTTSISLPAVAVTGSVFDSPTGTAGNLNYPDATSIALSGGVTTLTAASATSIVLGSSDYTSGLSVTATKANAVVDLSAATGSATTGAISITTAATGSVKLDKLAKAPNGLTLTGPATVSLPLLASGAVTSDAKTVTMNVHDGAIQPTLGSVTTLTMGAIQNPFDLSIYAGSLVKASVTGKTTTTYAGTTATVTTNTGCGKLTDLTLGGDLLSANVKSNGILTALTTSGRINAFVLDTNDKLASVTLGHNHYEGGPGSLVTVINNKVLTALKTSTDKMNTLAVYNNVKLASMDFSSYVTTPNAGAAVKILIGFDATGASKPNALTGTYTAPVLGTATTPFVEAKINCTSLSTLKAYVAALAAVPTPFITLSMQVDVDDVDATTTGLQPLSGKMLPAGDVFGTSVIDSTPGINIAKEYALVQ